MKDLVLPPLNPSLKVKIQPRLMKDTYKKVHIYLFDFSIVLGKGSFSKVYKGINLYTNEEVAVKVVQMSSITTPKLKQLLQQEIDILMKIKNENLIKCFEVLSSAKNTYIIMELCTYDFGSICDFIQKQEQTEKSLLMQRKNNNFLQTFTINHNQNNRKNTSTQYSTINTVSSAHNHHNTHDNELAKSINSISSTKSVQIEQNSESFDSINQSPFQIEQNLKEQKYYPFIRQIFEGLEYLQNQNIVHRDLKLSNIFLTASKACKIGDFGFATIIHPNRLDIKDTCSIGSPLYMSPQSYIDNIYSLKSDIWSFGIMIFEMIYGNPPHWNCPTHEVLKCQIKKPIDLNKFEKLAKISTELKQVLQGCLQVQSRKRFNIKELKQTKLFKRLFYQPLQSNVIVNSKKNQSIEQSSVQIVGQPIHSEILRNDSIQLEFKEFEYSNFSTIQKVKQQFKVPFELANNRLPRVEPNNDSRKQQKCQTFKPNDFDDKIYLQQMENNSFTERMSRPNPKNQQRSVTPPRTKINSQQQQQINNLKFKSTDLTGNFFKDANIVANTKQECSNVIPHTSAQNKNQFSYKNSEGMQKFIKQFKQIKKTQNQKCNLYEKPITFTNLSNILTNPKENNKENSKEQESPKFASTFCGPFFSSNKYSKEKSATSQLPENKEFAQNKSIQLNDLQSNSHSKSQQNQKKLKLLPSYSPRNNPSFKSNTSPYFNSGNKQNYGEQSLLSKNFSVGAFTSTAKKFSNDKQNEKYEYKRKILQKCTSSPKFQTYQKEKETKIFDRNIKNMTVSSFFSSTQATSSKNKEFNSKFIKDFNQKEEFSKAGNLQRESFMKTYDGSNNFMSQFSTKLKEPSHIQKKTHWKGSNNKTLTLNSGIKETQNYDFGRPITNNQNDSSNFNTMRNPLCLYATCTDNQEGKNLSRNVRKSQMENETCFNSQPSKLLNGEFIIKDACELIHFSRLLHKLSFMTENNSNSILLLQYGIQILNHLLQKCDNFEIKYHYDSSTGNSVEIREAFKANELSLNSLALINEKQCYAMKKDLSVNKQNSSVCNKTVQLRFIIQSYMKKYHQRKQALIKLFECNELFENLTNKVKQAKSSSTDEKSSIKKRPAINLQKAFTNFDPLQKALQQIEREIMNKRQNWKSSLLNSAKGQQSQNMSYKMLLRSIAVFLEAIQKCIQEHSFQKLTENTHSIAMVIKPNEKMNEQTEQNNSILELGVK